MGLKNWNPKQIRDALSEAGITQAGIKRDLGLKSDSSVCLVIDGAPSDRIRRHIARCLQVPVETIWPEVYLVGDGPRGPGRPKTRGLYDRGHQAA